MSSLILADGVFALKDFEGYSNVKNYFEQFTAKNNDGGQLDQQGVKISKLIGDDTGEFVMTIVNVFYSEMKDSITFVNDVIVPIVFSTAEKIRSIRRIVNMDLVLTHGGRYVPSTTLNFEEDVTASRTQTMKPEFNIDGKLRNFERYMLEIQHGAKDAADKVTATINIETLKALYEAWRRRKAKEGSPTNAREYTKFLEEYSYYSCRIYRSPLGLNELIHLAVKKMKNSPTGVPPKVMVMGDALEGFLTYGNSITTLYNQGGDKAVDRANSNGVVKDYCGMDVYTVPQSKALQVEESNKFYCATFHTLEARFGMDKKNPEWRLCDDENKSMVTINLDNYILRDSFYFERGDCLAYQTQNIAFEENYKNAFNELEDSKKFTETVRNNYLNLSSQVLSYIMAFRRFLPRTIPGVGAGAVDIVDEVNGNYVRPFDAALLPVGHMRRLPEILGVAYEIGIAGVGAAAAGVIPPANRAILTNFNGGVDTNEVLLTANNEYTDQILAVYTAARNFGQDGFDYNGTLAARKFVVAEVNNIANRVLARFNLVLAYYNALVVRKGLFDAAFAAEIVAINLEINGGAVAAAANGFVRNAADLTVTYNSFWDDRRTLIDTNIARAKNYLDKVSGLNDIILTNNALVDNHMVSYQVYRNHDVFLENLKNRLAATEVGIRQPPYANISRDKFKSFVPLLAVIDPAELNYFVDNAANTLALKVKPVIQNNPRLATWVPNPNGNCYRLRSAYEVAVSLSAQGAPVNDIDQLLGAGKIKGEFWNDGWDAILPKGYPKVGKFAYYNNNVAGAPPDTYSIVGGIFTREDIIETFKFIAIRHKRCLLTNHLFLAFPGEKLFICAVNKHEPQLKTDRNANFEYTVVQPVDYILHPVNTDLIEYFPNQQLMGLLPGSDVSFISSNDTKACYDGGANVEYDDNWGSIIIMPMLVNSNILIGNMFHYHDKGPYQSDKFVIDTMPMTQFIYNLPKVENNDITYTPRGSVYAHRGYTEYVLADGSISFEIGASPRGEIESPLDYATLVRGDIPFEYVKKQIKF